MFITVTCPKCGRNIKAKKKFVLSTGGMPCLKCKVRIPVSREQVEAYVPKGAAEAPEASETEAATAAPEAAAETEAASEPATLTPEPVAEETPQVEAETQPSEEAPVPEPPAPEPPPAEPELQAQAPEPQAAEPAPAPEYPADDPDTITAAIALDPVPEPAAPAEPVAVAAGAQIVFSCPYCQNSYPVRQNLAGKKIRCKGCARIVKVANDSPVVPGNEAPPPPPPPPPPIEDDIPVIYSTHNEPAREPVEPLAPPPPPPPPPPPVRSQPPPPTVIPETGNASETVALLKKALSTAEERAASAEEMLQRTNQEKFTNEMTAFRKIRDLEAQVRELTLKVQAREESAGAMKRSDVEALLKALCDELDANLQQEINAHKGLVEDLKRQLGQALK